MQSRVDDDAHAPLPKIPNRNLQPSANNFITQTLTFRPRSSSPLPSLGFTLGQVHQSTNALRAADYPSHPLWLWHALCNHVDYRFHFSTPLPFSLFIIFCPFASRCHIFDSVSFFFFNCKLLFASCLWHLQTAHSLIQPNPTIINLYV